MSPKLLLADDSITIQRVVELTFADQGVEVLSVGDGEAAIARIPVDQPDIVLADIGMPKRSGYDVSAFIKGHPDYRHIPVLLLAGAFEPVDEKRAEQVGCNGVLVKPFEPQHVISRVRELLGGAIGTPMQAVSDVGRPVDRLASPRTLEFPRREDTGPLEQAEAFPALPAPIDDDLGALPTTPDFAPAQGFAAPPGPSLEPAASIPEFNGGESLDDYFARLGAALESPPPSPPLAPPAAPPPSAPEAFHEVVPDMTPVDVAAPDARGFQEITFDEPEPKPEPEPEEVPTLDQVLSAFELPLQEVQEVQGVQEVQEVQLVQTAEPVEPFEPVELFEPIEPVHGNLVADAFTALLAVEEGELDVAPSLFPSGFKGGPVITEAMVDRIAERVIERLAPGTARDVVAQVVSEVAERLVREEIERVRSRQPAAGGRQ